MLLKFEFKKIYFKQFAFFIAIAVIVIKAIYLSGFTNPTIAVYPYNSRITILNVWINSAES